LGKKITLLWVAEARRSASVGKEWLLFSGPSFHTPEGGEWCWRSASVTVSKSHVLSRGGETCGRTRRTRELRTELMLRPILRPQPRNGRERGSSGTLSKKKQGYSLGANVCGKVPGGGRGDNEARSFLSNCEFRLTTRPYSPSRLVNGTNGNNRVCAGGEKTQRIPPRLAHVDSTGVSNLRASGRTSNPGKAKPPLHLEGKKNTRHPLREKEYLYEGKKRT